MTSLWIVATANGLTPFVVKVITKKNSSSLVQPYLVAKSEHAFGPSLMPGGDADSWKYLQPMWEAVAAKVDVERQTNRDTHSRSSQLTEGEPCTAYLGPNGAGHYVKMVHNGIEYADMQLICEAYHLLRSLLGYEPAEIGKLFEKWNEGILNSYLS